MSLTQCAKTIAARYLAGDPSYRVVYMLLSGVAPADAAGLLGLDRGSVRGVYLHYGTCYRYRGLLLKLFDFLDNCVEPLITNSRRCICNKHFDGDRLAAIDHVHKKHRDMVYRVLKLWIRELKSG